MARLSTKICFAIIALLPFVVPFDSFRNIDLQGLLLLLSGGLALVALLFRPKLFQSLSTINKYLLSIYAASCIATLLVSPHKGYDILGSPYIRLGSLGLVSCVLIGLLFRSIPIRQLTKYLYLVITSAAIISVPFSLYKFHTLHRIPGITAQADVFACIAGCGFLLGLSMLKTTPKNRTLVIANEVFLFILVFATQTRAVAVLLSLLFVFWLSQNMPQQVRYKNMALLLAVAFITSAFILLPGRLSNASYASESVHYRISLQHSGFLTLINKPMFGYGPGNLADALDCRKLNDQDLQETCKDGYFFNSSHNIYLDRFIGLGWIGGAAFLLFVCYAISGAATHLHKERQVILLATILISAYYLTNVTSIILELLFWILLLSLIPAVSRASTSP